MFNFLNLFSRVSLKVLLLVSVKDGEFYERQIAKEAKVSVGSATRILKEFTKEGFLTQTRKGKMLFYKRNENNVVLRQFKVLITVMKLNELIEALAPFASKIVLFGSCSQGTNGEKSDVDLLVVSNEKEKIRKLVQVDEKIQAVVVTVAEFALLEKKDKPLFDRISRGIALYE